MRTSVIATCALARVEVTSTYAYGLSSPADFVDPTGRVPVAVPYSPNCAAICREAAKEQEAKATGWQKVLDVDVDKTIKYTELGCLCTGLRKRDWRIEFWVAYRPSIKALDLAK